MIRPAIWRISEIHFPRYEKVNLSNGVCSFVVRGGTEPVFKLEICFHGGRWQEKKPGVAQATAAVLFESTDPGSGNNSLEEIEFYGAQTGHDCGPDLVSFQLLALNKHAAAVLPLFASLILDPQFTDDELDDFKKHSIEELSLQERSNIFLAEQSFLSHCFGSGHPYGTDPQAGDLRTLDLEHLREHHARCYIPENCTIFLSGAVDDRLIKLVGDHFGKQTRSYTTDQGYSHAGIKEYVPKTMVIKGQQASQAAIFMGRPAITRRHPDFRALMVTNTLLGGFFGSRLMRNVREEKGLTYHIGSSLENLLHGGILSIFTELSVHSLESCLKEISHELRRLREEKVSVEELEMVLNYMTGNFLSQCDGPFASADYLKQFVFETGEENGIEEDIAAFREIGPDEIMDCAGRYLVEEDLCRFIARKSTITH